MSQLAGWRVQACKRLQELVLKLEGDVDAKDGLVDDLIRKAGGQPPRPEGSRPYEGILGTADIQEGRKRAAKRLGELATLIQGELCSTDGIVDDVVRVLGGLPPRPADKQPYASLFPASANSGGSAPNQLGIWRIQAFTQLDDLVLAVQGGMCATDGLVDDLIRQVSGQPPRPGDRQPYDGILGTADVKEGRKRAANRFNELAMALQGGLCDTDALVDNLLRVLKGLPKRPADKAPYASLFPPSKLTVLTPEKLVAIAPEADSSRLKQLAPHLNRTMIEFKIDTPLRQAHFLAQLAHESDRFNALEEYASGSDYEWRVDLGNVFPGDGVRYKGRGLIQITGRNNYGECGRALGVDLIKSPTHLAAPDLACRSAGWYWENRRLNPDADRDDVKTVTRVINGGYNGLEDRIHLLTRAKRVLGV